MPTKLGHFEILSELAKSPTSIVYKANDPESGQTIVLKAIQLSAFGDQASALVQALQQEAEATKILSSPNLTAVYGAGEIEGQFCAAMEYVQGNSIATMLARKEGFSIWDLLDIGRQLTAGLDHASGHNIVHYSLEPAKIMCGWDGTVKILSFGVSSVGSFVHHVSGISPVLHYMSPEQVRGDSTDGRSNLFSLGAMFYEMVTEHKAFGGEDVDSLRQNILESTPVPPIQLNAKVHPLLSDLIMKALSKDPANRHQTGRQLLEELENCKEQRPAKKPEATKGTVASDQMKAAVASKFINSGGVSPKSATPVAPQQSRPPAVPPVARAAASVPSKAAVAAAPTKPSRLAMPKTAAAAASAGSAAPSTDLHAPDPVSELSIHSVSAEASDSASASMSSAVADEPLVETFEPQVSQGPKIAIDPLMAEGAPSGSAGTSFSEISELPPLKEVYVAPTSAADPEPIAPVSPAISIPRVNRKPPEKPKVQPKEVAQKAIKEIKAVPPKLFGYSLAAAGILILVIAIGVTYYVHSQNDDDSGSTRDVAPSVTQTTKPQPAPAQPAPDQQAAVPADTQTAEAQPPDTSTSEPSEAAPSRSRNGKKKSSTAPLIVPGNLTIDSTPQGAQVQFDGQTDPTWVTPLALTQIQPGQHSIVISKAGYSTDSRTVNIVPGSRSTTTARLSQLAATLIVKSNPAGANIFVDGHDVGTKTPAQVSVGGGTHLVLVRMSGYLDETMSAQFVLGQTFNFSPTLRALGNADSIKTVGKMSKLFGGKADKSQGVVSIHTSPKGAEVSVNQHMVEKGSPVDIALDPGNYVIDITLSGYAPIHRVVTVERGSKDVIDETLQPQ